MMGEHHTECCCPSGLLPVCLSPREERGIVGLTVWILLSCVCVCYTRSSDDMRLLHVLVVVELCDSHETNILYAPFDPQPTAPVAHFMSRPLSWWTSVVSSVMRMWRWHGGLGVSPQCFAVRSLGWVEMAEDDLAPGKSSVAVNNCIRQLSYCKNDIRDTIGIWGEVRGGGH